LRRPEDPGKRRWALDGWFYGTETEYLAAKAARDARRRRIMAWMEASERGESWHSFDARWRDELGDGSGGANSSPDSGFVPPRPAR